MTRACKMALSKWHWLAEREECKETVRKLHEAQKDGCAGCQVCKPPRPEAFMLYMRQSEWTEIDEVRFSEYRERVAEPIVFAKPKSEWDADDKARASELKERMREYHEWDYKVLEDWRVHRRQGE